MSDTPDPLGHKPKEEPPGPENSGTERSVESKNESGPKRLGGSFLNGIAEGVGTAVGALLVAAIIAGLVAGGVISETQNGPHQGGGAAVTSC
ncbi:hypothetical protein [Streptomyces erythrochromogenes]|uniref:hypothetical protein n=1 Tax=Streptomyces erythrochromogenes TaxID=285574 RepID=UPI00386378BF|nr:hypothetical protein OG364_00380 [Streptomyces erythrochromogenes]WST98462.1 hypothetical protein OG364_41155 [Streptomyces erythrochromogenes]